MDVEDDMIVLVVVDGKKKATPTIEPAVEIKQELEELPMSSMQVDALIETAEKHGEYISVKVEPPDADDNEEYEYLEEEMLQTSIKSENNDYEDEGFETKHDVADPSCDKVLDTKKGLQKHRSTMLKPSQRKSYVAQLKKERPELRKDQELLINTLEQIMRSTKPSPPPEGFYVVDGKMYQCVQCKAKKISLPAVTRHYQEMHGPRYLVCFACGVDFRCPNNLYKHEKRCITEDREIVLRARGQYLGRKGRSRPYLSLNKFTPEPNRPAVKRDGFPCQQCSAVFSSRQILQAHENLHRGERPYRCDACPAAYTSQFALSRHTKKHASEVLICDHCNRSFKIKAALVSHMDTHLPVRKFGCKKCGQRFARNAALLLHVRRVHLELPPPCACQVCPKRFPFMALLKIHMKREHGLSIITRNMFFKSLPTMTDLEVQAESKIIFQSEKDVP